MGDSEIGSGITTSLSNKLNQTVVSGDNFLGGYNKGEDGLVNLELDGTTGDDAVSCSGGLDNSGLIDEPSISLFVNGQDQSEVNLPNGSEINLSWESQGATNITLSSSDGKINNQDVTGQTSLSPIILESDVNFTITATNSTGISTDIIKIYQFGSENMPKGIYLHDVPYGMNFTGGETGEWDSKNDPSLWSQDGNSFSGTKRVSFVVDENICSSSNQKIINSITIIPYLGSKENNNSTFSGINTFPVEEVVKCGVSIGGNIRANDITGKITPKDDKPSLLIIGKGDSDFAGKEFSGNVSIIKYNQLINTDSIKSRIVRLYKESAKCKKGGFLHCVSPLATSSGIWKISPGETISGTFTNNITFIAKGGTLKINNVKGVTRTNTIGIIAMDTNVEIEGNNSNIAIYAYDTNNSGDDGVVSFISNKEINFTGAIVAEKIKLNDNRGNIDWAPDLQVLVPEGFSEILKPIISEKAP